MGAGASVQSEGNEMLRSLSSGLSEKHKGILDDVEQGKVACLQSVTESIQNLGEEQRKVVMKMTETASHYMDEAQLRNAANSLQSEVASAIEGMPSLGDNATVAMIGSHLQQASQLIPEVCQVVAAGLKTISPALPFIGTAGSLLGTLLSSVHEVRQEDERIANFVVWARALLSWLSLVADRVEASPGEQTVLLLQRLTEELEEILQMLKRQQAKSMLGKLFTQSHFSREFDKVNDTVRALKEALRDQLDTEAQIAQEKVLTTITGTTFRIEQKIDDLGIQVRPL